jgi:hypothetical protein
MTTRHAVTSFALALCSLTAVLARTDSVQATEVIGGTCVPDSATVREGFYETRGFGVGFRGNNAGTIRLLCPFVDTGTPDIITLSIIDQDGMEAGARVRAHFRRAKIGTNVAITIATCDSNTSNINGPHTQICEIQPRYKIRPIDEWYWWDVVIERTNPRVNVEFLGVGVRYFGPTL